MYTNFQLGVSLTLKESGSRPKILASVCKKRKLGNATAPNKNPMSGNNIAPELTCSIHMVALKNLFRVLVGDARYQDFERRPNVRVEAWDYDPAALVTSK